MRRARWSFETNGCCFCAKRAVQDPGETLEQALQRECLEEIGTRVEIQDLLHVADYFRVRDTVPPSTKHLVEFLFLCTVPGSYVPVNGSHPDKHQVEVVWTSLTELDTLPIFPRSLAGYLQQSGQDDSPVYLGLIS